MGSLPVPHLPPLGPFFLSSSHFCSPVKCFVCRDFPCGYLSADSARLALAQVLSFHGNFIIVLDAFQAPLDAGALLMSKETCMK